MSKKGMHFTVKELDTTLGKVRGLDISIGKIVEDTWTEPMGPTPYPSLHSLRSWDLSLLQRYNPFYMPFCDLCCMCTYGKCDLTGDKRGACGITMPAQQSRTVLLSACIGTATHIGHARELLDHLLEKGESRTPLDVGGHNVEIEAPLIRLVCGIKPRTISDLEEVVEYLEAQVTQLMAATHTGQESSSLDFESKVFHAGMIDQVALEVADIAQVSAFGFPKADPMAPLVQLGMGTVDQTKPVILVVGHNVLPSIDILDYLDRNSLAGEVEVTGICCTAMDMTRYAPSAKIVGPISWQLRYLRSGIPDVVVMDEQCIRADTLAEAQRTRTPVIATNAKNCAGLPDRTLDPVSEIVSDLARGNAPGALIFDPARAGEVAVKTALQVAPERVQFKAVPSGDDLLEQAKECTQCKLCRRSCPNDLAIPEAMKAAGKGRFSLLDEMYDECLGCARCEQACPRKIPIHSLITSAAGKRMKEETFSIRSGRGAIQDVEIRKVGGPIVLGEIPGVVAFVGCANYPKGGKEVAEMCMEFTRRRYIVVTSGCSAMSAAMYRDEEGKTPYEANSGAFEAGGLVNVGSCVSNAHIAGAAVKIASIFARRNLRGNYEEIADYVYNRVGAVGVAWGAMSQKAAAIASGFWRLGIPVVVGPHGAKYRRMLLGRADRAEDWYVLDARTGERVYAGPTPEHLFFAAETKEEAMVMVAKLCMRPNDTSKGRAIKLTHYLDLHQRYMGSMPSDVPLFVRTPADIPVTMKNEILERLRETGWKEKPIPDPTLLASRIRRGKGSHGNQ